MQAQLPVTSSTSLSTWAPVSAGNMTGKEERDLCAAGLFYICVCVHRRAFAIKDAEKLRWESEKKENKLPGV